MNYNMNGLEKSIMELHGMLKIAKEGIIPLRNSSLTTPTKAIREDGVKKGGPLILILREYGNGKLVIQIPSLRTVRV